MKIGRHVHFPTLVALVILYIAMITALAAAPHVMDNSAFGKMELHQRYAAIGKVLTFGLVDCTLTDWYMLGSTLEENIPPYNGVIRRSVLFLTPVLNATAKQREKYTISGAGTGLHWDELDEDISVPALLMGVGNRTRRAS